MQQGIVGWDIGGAHIKAVILGPSGVISNVIQLPCPLWKGMDVLIQAVKQIILQVPDDIATHAMTMTGELVDLFESRDQGVAQIIDVMKSTLGGIKLLIYAGMQGFLTPEKIQKNDFSSIASANWLASASLAANEVNNGLFVDIGSTTTDLLVLSDHKVQAIGLTDFDRMRSDELVYTGIVRTSVMAVAQSAYFKGQTMGLMAEYFATMADVYRLTGELNEAHDQTETADGEEKTSVASAKRLSRMIGYDYSECDLSLWKQFAQTIKSQQKNRIQSACERQISRGLLSENFCFVGAGVGRFLVKQIAEIMGHSYIDFTELFKHTIKDSKMDIADCAPAASVALLVSRNNIFSKSN